VTTGKRSYSKSLRAIGQDLESRGLKTFVLKAEAHLYVVECGYQEPPSPTPVTLHYTLQDIEELDRSGRARRGGNPGSREFVNLVQIFRAVGGYLDKNKCRLTTLSNNGLPSGELLLRVDYENADGERIVDDRSGTAIYDLCVSMYKQRGKDLDTADRYAYWRRKTG
jgi:hypothetical protein